MGKQQTEHKPVVIALVRDIHQRGWFKQIVYPLIRADGWIQDANGGNWYSRDNVISITEFTPRKWDGNGLEVGMLCELERWLGVTTDRPTGFETQQVMIISRSASKRACTVLLPDGGKINVGERKLAPIMGKPNAQG
jgi:hypothetical protein